MALTFGLIHSTYTPDHKSRFICEDRRSAKVKDVSQGFNFFVFGVNYSLEIRQEDCEKFLNLDWKTIVKLLEDAYEYLKLNKNTKSLNSKIKEITKYFVGKETGFQLDRPTIKFLINNNKSLYEMIDQLSRSDIANAWEKIGALYKVHGTEDMAQIAPSDNVGLTTQCNTVNTVSAGIHEQPLINPGRPTTPSKNKRCRPMSSQDSNSIFSKPSTSKRQNLHWCLIEQNTTESASTSSHSPQHTIITSQHCTPPITTIVFEDQGVTTQPENPPDLIPATTTTPPTSMASFIKDFRVDDDDNNETGQKVGQDYVGLQEYNNGQGYNNIQEQEYVQDSAFDFELPTILEIQQPTGLETPMRIGDESVDYRLPLCEPPTPALSIAICCGAIMSNQTPDSDSDSDPWPRK